MRRYFISNEYNDSYCQRCHKKCNNLTRQEDILTNQGRKNLCLCQDCANQLISCQNCNNQFFENDKQQYNYKYTDKTLCKYCSDQILVKCQDCDKYLQKQDNLTYEYEGQYFCEDCFHQRFSWCENCDSVVPLDDMFNTYNQKGNEIWVCSDCLSDFTQQCDYCKNTINKYQNYSSSCYYDHNGNAICENCYQDHYFWCERCNDVYFEDEMGGSTDNGCYCYDCWRQLGGRDIDERSTVDPQLEDEIRQYSHGTKLVVKLKKRIHEQQTTQFIGVQLQLENSNQDGQETSNFINQVSKNKKLICKADGSLNEAYGVQICTQPCTYNYHLKTMGWQHIFSLAKEYHMNDTTNGGLHFHVSRNNFTSDQLKCLDYFVNNCVSYLSQIGGRNYGDAQQGYWSKAITDKQQWGKNHKDRYQAVNFQNENTVQLRFPKATSNYNIFKKRLKMIHNICQLAKFFSFDDVKAVQQQGLIYIFTQLIKQL